MKSKESSGYELKKLIEFFGLDSSVMDWRFHEEKNFLCLYKPVKFCLEENKGKTRNVSSDDYDQDLVDRYPELQIWRRAYSSQMIEMYQKICKCYNREDCCELRTKGPCQKEPERWRWLRKYYCDFNFS